jgi:hypothetical protein
MLFVLLFYVILWEDDVNVAITNLRSLRFHYVRQEDDINATITNLHFLHFLLYAPFQEDDVNATSTNVVQITKIIDSFLP